MLYFYRDTNDNSLHASTNPVGTNYTTRHDFGSFADAQAVADELNGFPSLNIAPFGDKYIAIDCGRCVSPRYDVVEKPAKGDKVSYAFNGDYYPCGEITSISKTLKRIKTTTGATFYRVRQTGSWKMNKTWSLVAGHHDKRNPSF